MANAIYPKYKQSVLTGDASSDLTQSTANVAPYVAMVSSAYTYSSSHQFYSSLSGVVGTDQQLTTPTTTSGTFDADDATFTAVTGSAVAALVIYRKNAGANSTWRLVLFEDTSVTGLPVTPNGGNIVITWNASGIFTISDNRLKENVAEVGRLGSLKVYEYNYTGEAVRRRGFMAQDVAHEFSDAVIDFDCGGLSGKAVNYDRVIERIAA